MKLTAAPKKIWEVAMPVMVSAYAQQIVSMTDTIFLNRIGEAEAGSCNLAGIVYFTLIILGFGLATGVQVLVARRLGEDKPHAVGTTVDHAVQLALIATGLIVGVVYGIVPLLLKPFIASQIVYAYTIEYLFYRVPDVPFALTLIILRGFYNGLSINNIIIVSAVVMAGANIVLDYLLIFGHWGFPAWGVKGAAIASDIAQVIGLGVLILHLQQKGYIKQYGLFRLEAMRWSITRLILQLSGPTMLQYVITMSSFGFFFLLIEKYGERALAVSTNIKNLYLSLMIPTWCFGTAAATLASNLIGQKLYGAVRPLLMQVSLYSLALALVLVVIVSGFPKTILSIFAEQDVLIYEAMPVLWVILVSLVVYSVSGVLLNAVIGTGATGYAFITETATVVIYVAYLFAAYYWFDATVIQLWYCEFIYTVVIGLMCFFYLRTNHWYRYTLQA